MIVAGEGESQCINRRHWAASDRLQRNMAACVCQIKWLRNWTRQFNGFAAAILGSAGEMGELGFAGGSEIKTPAELKWRDPLWHGRWTRLMHKFNFRPINYKDCAVIAFVAYSKSLYLILAHLAVMKDFWCSHITETARTHTHLHR